MLLNSRAKFFLIFGSSTISFSYSLTSPILQIYFISLISAPVLAVSNIITVGLAALVNSSVPYERIKQMYRDNFIYIVFIDVLCFCIVSFLSVEHVVIRFIGFSILNAVSTNIWSIVIRDAVNQVISGDDLTNWSAYYRSYELWASFIGGILAIFLTNISVEICIALQCAANIIMGAGDIYSYNLLKKEKNSIELEKEGVAECH